MSYTKSAAARKRHSSKYGPRPKIVVQWVAHQVAMIRILRGLSLTSPRKGDFGRARYDDGALAPAMFALVKALEECRRGRPCARASQTSSLSSRSPARP